MTHDESLVASDLRERVTHLKNSDLFSLVGDELLAEIAAACETVALEPGGLLFKQGEDGDAAFVILEGSLEVEVATETGPVIVATLGTGEVVGEIAAFSNRTRNASVSSPGGARLLRIGRETIRELIQRDPSCAMNVIAGLGGRLESNNSSIAVMSQAANALAAGAFDPAMLAALKQRADRFSHLAKAFETMAREIETKHQFLKEMETAELIQRTFLPKTIDMGDRADRVRIAARMIPAKHVGGDFFDYFIIDDSTIGIAVGDVSGKGIPAAIFMSVSRTVLRTIARQGLDAGEVLTQVNRLLAEDNAESMFVTLIYAQLNLDTGRLDYANAGHEEAFIVRADATLYHLARTGPAVGLIDMIDFKSGAAQLAPGDMVLLGTDGITEAFHASGEMFGDDRFHALMQRLAAQAAEAAVEGVIGEILAFSTGMPQSDDLTCLVARYEGAP